MSTERDYLIEVAPEVMDAHSTMTKACGSSLDSKTRYLVSLINKVYAQSEQGLRRHLARALTVSTPKEILSFLFAAMPILGFSRIMWAVRQILTLGLPEFEAESLNADTTEWHSLGDTENYPQGITYTYDQYPHKLFVYHNHDEFKAYSSRCPHQLTEISAMNITGPNTLTCSLHGKRFDLETGLCLDGDYPLREFEIKNENGTLYAYW